MPELVRVKLHNGVQKTLPASHPAVTAEGVETLDKPAVDPITGALVPDKAPADLPPAGDGYTALRVPELLAEIAARNEGRDPADHIPATGKKPDLIAALEADDAAQNN